VAHPTQPAETFVREALGLTDPAVAIALLISPSFRPSRLLSLRRATRARRLLRVTHLEPKAWAPVFTRMRELQGPSLRLAQDEQLRSLAEVALRSSTVEHDVDRQTADLLAEVWRALLRRVQVVHSDVFTIDGTRYEFWGSGQAGTVVSPRDGSVLEQVTRAAERLARLAEARGLDSESAISYIRQDLREALARTWRNKPCVRSISR